MITGTIVGGSELIARLGRMPAAVKAEVDMTVQKLGFELERRVKVDYLTGQVLKVRTDRLRGSISVATAKQPGDSRSRFEATGTTSFAYVGTNVSYGVMWSKGIAAHDIVPVKAKALRFEIGGEILFRKRVSIPAQAARPFLEPALESMRPLIMSELESALKRGAEKALAS